VAQGVYRPPGTRPRNHRLGRRGRHPDLGPWNGIQAEIDVEGNIVLVDREASTPGTRHEIGTEEPYTGTLAAGGPDPANTRATH
jgi:hypothetical protein